MEIKWKNFFWSQKLVARWSISNSLKQFRPELDWWYIWCNMIYSYYVIINFMYIVCIVEKYFSLNFLFGSPIQDPHTWNLIFQLSVSGKRKKGKVFMLESTYEGMWKLKQVIHPLTIFFVSLLHNVFCHSFIAAFCLFLFTTLLT